MGSIESGSKLVLGHLVRCRFFRHNQCSNAHSGQIYAGYNINSGEQVAIKLECRSSGYLHLENERKAYRTIGKPQIIGLPRIKWSGVEKDYTILVLTLLGPSLEDIFTSHHCKFNLMTTLTIADQLVC